MDIFFTLALLVFGTVGVVTYLSWYWSSAEQLKRALARAKRFSISALPEDTLGRVVGTARPVGEPLLAPMTERPCVYYRVEVRQTQRQGHRTIITESRSVPFFLEDETGRAMVDPEGASVALEFDSRSKSGTLDDPTDRESAFLARHSQTGTGLLFNKGLQYLEAVIHIGEKVAILGSAVREPDPDAPRGEGYRDAPPTRLRFASSKKMPLQISDAPSTTT